MGHAFAEPNQAGEKIKPPFTVLYSNDTTNTMACSSSFHERGQDFKMSMLEATVDETAGTGVQVHMLQPGFTWVPFWQSKILPAQEHLAWWKEYTGQDKSGPFMKKVVQGQDFIASFVNSCNKNDITPFISLRLNDGHRLESINDPRYDYDIFISKFYIDHPEYRIGTNLNSWDEHVHNWAIPEVRQYKFAMIEEVCQNYKFAGLELDLMRHPVLFNLNQTTAQERKEIMTNFIKRISCLLEETSEMGKRRWLCVRIPLYIEVYDRLGIDLPEWVKAGVDMVNASGYFFTDQQGDLSKINEMIPYAAKYLEMTYCAAVGPTLVKAYDGWIPRRATDEMLYTTAHLAYSRNFTGVSLFNFAYYRKHGRGDRANFTEPPFHVLKNIGNKEWLSKQKQHYFIGEIWNNPKISSRPMPQILKLNKPVHFDIDMAPPSAGWKKDGHLRIQSDQVWQKQKLQVSWNKTRLQSSTNVAEPYPTPYKTGNGKPGQYKAYTVPKEILSDGINQIEVILTEGKGRKIIYLDLTVE